MKDKEQIVHIKECLITLAEGQLSHLEQVDTKEYGEIIDMIKDLEEAMYYRTITEAMEQKDWRQEFNKERTMYMDAPNPNYYKDLKRYPNMNYPNLDFPYQEKEMPMDTLRDHKEGRSPHSRRMYMEAKETHLDKTTQMRELEKYMQELTQDLVEMIEDASPEEKQYLEKRLSVLASKVAQMNG